MNVLGRSLTNSRLLNSSHAFKIASSQIITRSCNSLRIKNRSTVPIDRFIRIPASKIIQHTGSKRTFLDHTLHSKQNLSSTPNSTLTPLREDQDRITVFRAGEEDSQSIQSFDELRPKLNDLVEQTKKDGEKTDSPFVWLDVTNPNISEIKEIGHAFGLHRLTIEDVAEGERREKVEQYDNVSERFCDNF